jgi:quinol-cytochrome oxidoreductase complex cytochrome b subunit
MADHQANDSGATVPEQHKADAEHSFYPFHVIDTAIIAYVIFGVLLTLAILHPFSLHEPADPLRTPPGIKPEWYFLPMYQGIKYLPPVVGVLGSGLVFALIIVWPFVDALVSRWTRWRRFHVLVGGVGLAIALLLGTVGLLCERSYTVGGQRYDVDVYGIPHASTADEPPAPAHK